MARPISSESMRFVRPFALRTRQRARECGRRIEIETFRLQLRVEPRAAAGLPAGKRNPSLDGAAVDLGLHGFDRDMVRGHADIAAQAQRLLTAIGDLAAALQPGHQRIRIGRFDAERAVEIGRTEPARLAAGQRHQRGAGGAKIQPVEGPGPASLCRSAARFCSGRPPSMICSALNSICAGIGACGIIAPAARATPATSRSGSAVRIIALRQTCRHRAAAPTARRAAAATRRSECRPGQRISARALRRRSWLRAVRAGAAGSALTLAEIRHGVGASASRLRLGRGGSRQRRSRRRSAARAPRTQSTPSRSADKRARAGIDVEMNAGAVAVGALAG